MVRPPLAALATAVVIACLAIAWRQSQDAAPAASLGGLASAPALGSSKPEARSTRAGDERIEAVIASIERSFSATTTAVPVAAGRVGREACSWLSDWRPIPPRALFSLMARAGPLSAANLARWSVLNPADAPLCPEECAELEALVAAVRDQLDHVAQLWRDLSLAEQVEAIEAGRVEEFRVSPESEAGQKALALAVEAYLATQARAGIATTEAEARDQLRDHIPPPLDQGYVQHKDRYYLLSAFVELPRSEELFEQFKFLLTQSLLGYQMWFEAHGFPVDNAAMNQWLGRVAALSQRDVWSL